MSDGLEVIDGVGKKSMEILLYWMMDPVMAPKEFNVNQFTPNRHLKDAIKHYRRNTTANTFSVKISRDEPISEFKEAIKAKKQNDFADVDADRLNNLTLQDQDELLATKKISKYFSISPAEEHIYVLVEPPKTTTTSNREQELLEEVTSLYTLLTMGFKWTIDIEDVTLEGLKEYIRKMDKPPALENNGAVLKLISNGKRYSPQNNQDLQKVLRHDDPNPSIDVHPVFHCGCIDLGSKKSKVVIKYLIAKLKLRQDVISLTRHMRQ
ncbi:hypothetical protein C1645_840570 [Glomus cerebriforme]|uniref:Crinkler effector protein N-terminal domain-containing protein n=1 Tax=Glomus cerebriforme TaxID=658196 RepID=A0A397RZ33_9GLOM|nr:hypothetical protein C1645_840570 [Glomus cerebriforme]